MDSQTSLELINLIIKKFVDLSSHQVFVFGSRATNKANAFSDYDIGIIGPELKSSTYFELLYAFEESNLPYKVDLVQFSRVSEDFKKAALKKIIRIT